jgi:prevent-host-death family protein
MRSTLQILRSGVIELPLGRPTVRRTNVEVGVRELRNHLSQFLARVEAGKEVVVTDRGRAVARLGPISGERTIDRLIASGLVTPARTRKSALPPPIVIAGTVSDLVADQRR